MNNDNAEIKTYLTVYSDEEITSLGRASLNADEFQKMLVFRNKLKQMGCSFLVVEENLCAVDGKEALQHAERLTVLRGKTIAAK
jgi:hypothetical protein